MVVLTTTQAVSRPPLLQPLLVLAPQSPLVLLLQPQTQHGSSNYWIWCTTGALVIPQPAPAQPDDIESEPDYEEEDDSAPGQQPEDKEEAEDLVSMCNQNNITKFLETLI